MRLAVDVLSIRPDGSAGGATGFAIELIKGLMKRKGIQVFLLCSEENISYLKEEISFPVRFLQVTGNIKFLGIPKLDRFLNRVVNHFGRRNLLAKNRNDILYCPFSAPTLKEKGIPTVSTILDIQHEFYPQFFAPQELQHRRKFYADIVKKVERVVCISDYTRETFCEKYNFPAERAQTIYIAIQNRFNKEDDTILDKLSIRDQEYVVYPANFWEHKNHKLLLNAFSMYISRQGKMKLVLTGNPLEQTAYYNSLLEKLGIAERTVITGYVSNEQLYSILKNAKGLIYPSLFEGFGIPVVEAMYLHKSIACSNLTSLPEIGCDSIYYFNPKNPDEILKGIIYIENQEITDSVINEYERKLSEYQKEKMVSGYLSVFEELMNDQDSYIFDEEVTGIYPDRWSSREITVQLKDRVGYRLLGKLSVPEFIQMKINVSIENGVDKKQIQIAPGTCVNIEELINQAQSTIVMKISKVWSPQNVLGSNDSRELGIMVDELLLQDELGNNVDLQF